MTLVHHTFFHAPSFPPSAAKDLVFIALARHSAYQTIPIPHQHHHTPTYYFHAPTIVIPGLIPVSARRAYPSSLLYILYFFRLHFAHSSAHLEDNAYVAKEGN